MDELSPADSIYPLLFEPVLKDYIWGGRNLKARLGRDLPDHDIAESWEIAAHKDGNTVVRNGRFKGMTLGDLQAELGLVLVGRRSTWAVNRSKFPLLIKLLDANDKLSVQVHPNDEYALAHEGNELGKTEMWVVLYAEPGSEIILGVRAGTTKEKFAEAIQNGTLETHLHTLPISTGDFVCVPSGTVHAILGGALIAEIQQNSNTTYRVYDWNRQTPDGKTRPLHIQQAIDVIDFSMVEPHLLVPAPLKSAVGTVAGVQISLLCENRYFTTERVDFSPGSQYSGNCDGETFEIWGVIQGTIFLNDWPLSAVTFTLLPAALGEFEITAVDDAACLRTYVNSLNPT